MIGIVVVSHSPRLAQATVDLALEMVGGEPPPIGIAAGAGQDIIGTDATKVAAAIEHVSSPDGVLVFMDLGSAVLSSTMALDFLEPTAGRGEVRLSDAPFVEGLIAAVVLAAAGASLDEVDREASAAMDAKRGQLERPAASAAPAPSAASALPEATAGVTAEVTLVNKDGLHSRPAATIVRAMSQWEATVTLTNVTKAKGPVSTASLVGIMSLGAVAGDMIRIAATGPQAHGAVQTLRILAVDGFGELHPEG